MKFLGIGPYGSVLIKDRGQHIQQYKQNTTVKTTVMMIMIKQYNYYYWDGVVGIATR